MCAFEAGSIFCFFFQNHKAVFLEQFHTEVFVGDLLLFIFYQLGAWVYVALCYC